LIGINIGKSENGNEYEVCVQKNEPTDEYVPEESDDIKYYVDNGNSISFFFDTYLEARHFADVELPLHQEFQERPVTPIRK
jgi:hypothetical protein